MSEGTFDIVLGDRSTYIMTPRVINRGDKAITIENVSVRIEEERVGERFPFNLACAEGVCIIFYLDPCESGACPRIGADGDAVIEIPVLPPVVTRVYQERMDMAVAEGRVAPAGPTVYYDHRCRQPGGRGWRGGVRGVRVPGAPVLGLPGGVPRGYGHRVDRGSRLLWRFTAAA